MTLNIGLSWLDHKSLSQVVLIQVEHKGTSPAQKSPNHHIMVFQQSKTHIIQVFSACSIFLPMHICEMYKEDGLKSLLTLTSLIVKIVDFVFGLERVIGGSIRSEQWRALLLQNCCSLAVSKLGEHKQPKNHVRKRP